ncbi:MAG: hypothetical protein CM1200mP41_05880 [Gammaproteobacteria bacterium]|nr:MAG: hypothetical protein CM1200mP41_05880 [Gammaproteobacteria bacterium]
MPSIVTVNSSIASLVPRSSRTYRKLSLKRISAAAFKGIQSLWLCPGPWGIHHGGEENGVFRDQSIEARRVAFIADRVPTFKRIRHDLEDRPKFGGLMVAVSELGSWSGKGRVGGINPLL